MSLSSGHWYAVLSARALRRRPVGRERFGERLVFWRAANGEPACALDRCAHRGAALSLGRVADGAIECPFHGFRFDATGQCIRVPAEGSRPIPAQLCLPVRRVRESDGFIWLWRGPDCAEDMLPPVPSLELLAGLDFGEAHSEWSNHYTRCIENVIDYSHLPFVHRRNLGLFIRDPETRVRVEPTDAGFRFYRESGRPSPQFVEFIYPNVWINYFGGRFHLAASFVPVDDQRTEVCVRWYHALGWPLIRQAVDLYGRWIQRVVFRDDLPIVASQRPRNVDQAAGDHLVPSDAALLTFRRLRRTHQEQIRRFSSETEPRPGRPTSTGI